MEQQNQSNTPDGLGDVPLKRKRGRPRKYPRPDSEEGSYMLLSQNRKQNPAIGERTPGPPGFEGVNGSQQHLQRDQENDSNNAMVGKEVSGVIEAVFDAGFLLSVRVGDSDTTLRGLVFKPGRYVPISPENDVAPGVPMIQRNEVPLPSRTTQVQNTPAKERNEQQHVNVQSIETPTMNGASSTPHVPRGTISSSNLVASSGKNVPFVVSQMTPQPPRGNMVPILIQPDNFSNGMPVSNQTPQVMTQFSIGSGSIAREIPVNGNQPIITHTQTSQNMLSSGMQIEGIPHYQSSSNVQNENESSSTRVPNIPFEHLVTEVVKRIQDPSDAMNTETDNSQSGDKILAKDPSSRQEDKADGMDQPILIKPLQAVQSQPHENSSSAPKPSDYSNIGKMTELLQMMQDNKTENQASKAAELGAGNKLDDVTNLGTELGDGGTVQSAQPF